MTEIPLRVFAFAAVEVGIRFCSGYIEPTINLYKKTTDPHKSNTL